MSCVTQTRPSASSALTWSRHFTMNNMGLPDKIQVSPGENSPPDKTVTYASVLNDRETLILPTSTSLNNPRQESPTFRLSQSGISKRQRTLSPPQQHFNFSPILSKTDSKFNLQATSKPHDPVVVADPPDNKSTSMDISLPPPSSSAPPIEDMVT
ncbi:predicted protein [Lichtheimia corymbifera JMRC:FSU:9682]|uniref:Uncharacterized protein n=1 Tax=Lichtheimia corymbifera JMRC:FSU:9682 TaxID=1263082 RepID=A0A068S4K6_9FUNG|nr:predicted protein [Lichtheimia corymbifera JMRC:FSU:9682]